MTTIPKLRFKEFSDDWEEKKLGHILSFKNGINASKEQYGTGYKFINVLDIINNTTIMYDNIIGSVDVSADIFEKNKIEYGNILFQRSSETREDAGQASVYLDKERAATFGGFVIRGQQKQEYDPKFINYMFKTSHARKEITQKSNGSTRYNVGQDTLSKVLIFLPQEQEQQKIATFLTLIDNKIEQLKKKIVLLEKYKKVSVQKIFSQKIRFKDDDGSEFGDWEEKKISDFLILTLREINKPLDNYLAIGIRSHCKGTFQKPDSDPTKIAMDKLYVVKTNDLIVNITFAWEGAIAIVKKEDEGGLVSHRFPTYTFNEEITTPKYFKYIMTQKKFVYRLGLISPGGAGRNKVMSKKDFIKLKLMLPLLEEQEKIASFLSSIDKKINETTQQLKKMQIFKKALLQQMFI